MSILRELRRRKAEFLPLSFHEQFVYIVVLLLTALIAIVIVAAAWNLILKILIDLVLSGSLDPTDYTVFQDVFGMILTVIIALEFKKSLLVVAAGGDNVAKTRSVVMIALFAICLKVIVLDVTQADPLQVIALAAAILALGIVYWLVSDPARRLPNEPDD